MAVFQWSCIYGHGNLNFMLCSFIVKYSFGFPSLHHMKTILSTRAGQKTGSRLDLTHRPWSASPLSFRVFLGAGLLSSDPPTVPGPASPPLPTPPSRCISSWSPCFALCLFPCGQAYMSWLICSWLGWRRFHLQQSLQVLCVYDSVSLWSFFLKDLGKSSKGFTRRIKTHYCVFFQNLPSKCDRLEFR